MDDRILCMRAAFLDTSLLLPGAILTLLTGVQKVG